MGRDVEDSAEAQHRFRTEALPWLENVRRFARSLCHDPADTDDLVQETYFRAYLAWHTFATGTDCRRWLFTICRNVHRRWLREARTLVTIRPTRNAAWRVKDGAAELAPVGGSQAPDDLIAQLDLAVALDKALPQVPEPYRSTLLLVLVDDQSYEAAAAQLDVPVGTIRSRLCRARRIVRRDLESVARDAGVLKA